MRSAALLLLTACAPPLPPAACVANGLQLYGRSDCDAFTVAVLRSEGALAVPFPGHVYETLAPVVVRVQAAPTVAVPGTGEQAYGYAQCELDDVVLGSFGRWEDSALAHELAHVLDCRVANRWADTATHPQWAERGIYAAIAEANTP